jgi:hypothetical protein
VTPSCNRKGENGNPLPTVGAPEFYPGVDLTGESPGSVNYPVGAVVISGDGAGDQTVGSPDVDVLVGWMRIRSAPTGGQAKQQVVAQANRS